MHHTVADCLRRKWTDQPRLLIFRETVIGDLLEMIDDLLRSCDWKPSFSCNLVGIFTH